MHTSETKIWMKFNLLTMVVHNELTSLCITLRDTGRELTISLRPYNSGSRRVAEAIFEVKTLTACKSGYGHNNTKTAPLDRRARMIVSSYSSKFKTLDVKFAADVVGDGKWDIKSPFDTAYQ